MNNYLKLIHGYNIYQNFDHTKYVKIINGWNVNPVLYEKYIDKLQPKIILELGSWLGASAISMAKIIKDKKLDTKIICIDTWLGSFEFIGLHDSDSDRALMSIYGYPSIYYQFLANVLYENVEDIIIPLPNTTQLGCQWLTSRNITVDMVYIDADNSFESVYSDLHNSWLLLNNGGVLFGDDLENPGFPGIKFGLNKFCAEKRLMYASVADHSNFWEIFKH